MAGIKPITETAIHSTDSAHSSEFGVNGVSITESVTSALANLAISSRDQNITTMPSLSSSQPLSPLTLPKKKAARKSKRDTLLEAEKYDVVKDFENYFGNETKLMNWVRLCIDLGIENLNDFTSIKKCRLALASVWINIVDFMVQVHGGGAARRFKSQRALAEYTINTGKFYPKKKAKENGPIRALLAHIFGHS